MGKRKPNKAERDKKRAERADLYEQAFKHGYDMGFLAGHQRAVELAQREINKVMLRGT